MVDRHDNSRKLIVGNTQLYRGKFDQEFVREAQALYTLEQVDLLYRECVARCQHKPAIVLGVDMNAHITANSYYTITLKRAP